MRLHWLATLVLVSACGADEPEPLKIDATVRYSGTAQGALVVAAFTSIPPMGAPMAWAQNPTPTFPAVVSLADTLEPSSTVYVLAMIDVAPASPQQPGPEDRTVWSPSLTLTTEGAVSVELMLKDP